MESNRGPSAYQPSAPYRLAKPAHSLYVWSMGRLSVSPSLSCSASEKGQEPFRHDDVSGHTVDIYFIITLPRFPAPVARRSKFLQSSDAQCAVLGKAIQPDREKEVRLDL